MKRIKAFFIILFCVFLLPGCSGEKAGGTDSIITLSEEGEWQADKYVLPEYNFKFQRPAKWKRLLPNEIDTIFGEGSSDYYKMIVVNNTNKIIISIFFEDSNGLDQEKYLESIQTGMEKEEAVTYQFQEPGLQVVGGMEFAVMRSNIQQGGEEGVLSDQMYLVHEQGSRMLCITIKYEKEYKDVVEALLEDNFLSNLDEE